jgi:Ni/Fe-hydrogenase subunit HybB-like protein
MVAAASLAAAVLVSVAVGQYWIYPLFTSLAYLSPVETSISSWAFSEPGSFSFEIVTPSTELEGIIAELLN